MLLLTILKGYEYKNEFDFDLYDEEELDKLFSHQIIQRGKKYHEEDKIKFLEKVEDRLYAIVEGTEKYLVIFKYNEEERKMQVYCSCSCEFKCKHIYAVILAIRNKEYKRFYKIIYRNPNMSLLERVMDFDYVLCTGVVEQNLEIVNNYGELELVPILDVNGQYNWQVLEDSEDEKLTKQIKYFLDNEKNDYETNKLFFFHELTHNIQTRFVNECSFYNGNTGMFLTEGATQFTAEILYHASNGTNLNYREQLKSYMKLFSGNEGKFEEQNK